MRSVLGHRATAIAGAVLLFAGVVMLIADTAAAADPPSEVWTRQFGTAEGDSGWGVAVDGTDVYVTGYTMGTFDGQTHTGRNDVFVRKYDKDGSEVWTRQFGTTENDYGYEVAVDATGVYVTGSADGALPGQTSSGSIDAFVRKYDKDGSEVWTRQFGTAGADGGRGVAVDATGVYVAGSTSGDGDRLLVRKYDKDGNEVWTDQSLGFDGHAVAVDATGVYVTGGSDWRRSYLRKYDIDGNEVWTRQFGIVDDYSSGVAVDATGVYVTGDTDTGRAADFHDVFVRKFDKDGNEVWADQFGTGDEDGGSGVAADSTGVYVTGLYLYGRDAFVRRYDTDGNVIWTDQFTSGVHTTEGHAVAVGATGISVTGVTVGALPGQTHLGGHDAFVRRYDHSPVLCLGEVATIVGTEGADTLRGTAGDDVIHGRGGHDTINGRGGDDVICGGEGNDTIYGKAGNDQINGGAGSDKLNGGAGNDVLVGEGGKDTAVYFGASAGVTVDLAAGTGGGADQGSDTITGVEHVTGSLFGDVLRGNAARNRLKGLAGADKLYGLGGVDTLIGAGNNDRIRGGAGNDVLQGKAGDDRMFGNAGDDTIKGNRGDDTLDGGNGTDTLKGGAGTDTCRNGEHYVTCELPL